MITPQIPENEQNRLTSLRSHGLLDTLPEAEYDDLVSIASSICETPIAIISLIDEDRQWFKSIKGLPPGEMPRELSFCAHAINNHGEILQVEDTLNDDRFSDNPLVKDDPKVRFYAGAPIMDSNGFALGTLCVVDQKPRNLNDSQLKALRSLANSVQHLLALRLTLRELEESKFRYEELLSNVGDFIFELDESGFYTYANESLERASEYDLDSLKGMRFAELVFGPDLEKLLVGIAKKIKTKKKESYDEFRIKTKSGKIIWIGQTSKLSYEGDRLTKVWAVARDINDRRNIEESLKKQEAKYRLLSDNASDLICLHEPEGRYTFVSPSVKRLLGYEPDELMGKGAYEFFHKDDINHIRENAHKQALKGIDVQSVIYRLKRKDGDYIWAETYTTPIKGPKGDVIALQTATRDISKLILQQEALRESKQRAESAVIEKSNFLSTMSHEIRTPLNAIIGIGNILSDDSPLPNQVQYLNMLKFSGENLMNLVNNILDFSKIEESKIKLNNEPFALKGMVLDIANSLKLEAKESNINLDVELDESLPEAVIGDQMRIIQVLNNLITNAIKFANQTQVIIRVRIESNDSEKAKILFEVEDYGIGIPTDKLEQIFDRFVQASGDTTRKFGGSGLGLSISNKLLELMGSKIEVESEKGRGSKFYFSLELPISKSNARVGISNNRGVDLSEYGINLLLVEDNEINRLIAMRFLKKWGLNVDYAEDGLLAIEVAKKKKYDIVLIDIQMPVMDGYESSRIIHKLDGYDSVPFIALTASTEAHLDTKSLKNSPISCVISKPFNPDKLLKEIVKLLKLESELKGTEERIL